MIDHLIGRVADDPAMTLMPGFGTTGLGLLPLLLSVPQGRLGRGVRRLLQTLQPQHQLNQLFLAQSLKVTPARQSRESAIRLRHMGVSCLIAAP